MTTASSQNVRASAYRTWIDPVAIPTRQQMRRQAPRDLASGTLRLALHLSEAEAAYLEFHNPDTLGHPDTAVHDAEWAKFIKHSDSAPYRVNRV